MELEVTKHFIRRLVRRRDDLSLTTIITEIRDCVERELSAEIDTDHVVGAADELIEELDMVFNPNFCEAKGG